MYLPFVMFGYTATLALLLLGCRLVARTIPDLRGINELSWAIGCAVVGVTLAGLRPWAPAFVSILITNAFLLVSFLLLYLTAARVLREKASFLPWGIGLLIAVLPGFCYATWIQPNIGVRIVLSSGTVAIICAATAGLLFHYRAIDPTQSAVTVACLQFGNALINAGRCVLSILHAPTDFVRGDWVQTGFTYSQMILCIGTCCGIVWLALARHRAGLEVMATTDSMTGLLNRRAFDELLVCEMQRSRRSGQVLGLILLDLDWFKAINDTYGHFAGDEAIRRVSAILKRETRPGDSLARYGGEEFVVLLRKATLDQTHAIAERLRASIEQCAELPSRIRLTASIGVALSDCAESMQELFNRCDKALYESKHSGRNTVTIWPSLSNPAGAA